MHGHTQAIAAEIAHEDDRCPNCDMVNWGFSGNTREGFTSLQCMTCGRLYLDMSGFEEIAHIAGRLAAYAVLQDSTEVSAWHSRLVTLLQECRMGRWEQRRWVLTFSGEEKDDDSPF